MGGPVLIPVRIADFNKNPRQDYQGVFANL